MGIHPSSIDNAEVPPERSEFSGATNKMLNEHKTDTSRSSSRISNKFPSGSLKISPNTIQMYANLQQQQEDDKPILGVFHSDIENNAHEVVEEHVLPDNFDDEPNTEPMKSSVSPSSRKSASSHTSKGSEDSGIGIPVNKTNTNNVEEHNVPKKVPKKRETSNNMSKAWYDVPSDDDTEAPEADSLASIISHRGSSDEEH